MSQDTKILDLFEKVGGMLKGHFLLTSGRHAGTYMQCALIFSDYKASSTVCGLLAQKLTQFDFDAVVSPAMGGIIMGYEISKSLGVKNYFLERVQGEFELRRGFELNARDRVLVVEDVVTTGGSVREVVKKVQALGASVVAVASVVDRSAGKVDFGVPFVSLLSMDIESFDALECPICKTGAKLVKPGSRASLVDSTK